jgi:hypothetical protein
MCHVIQRWGICPQQVKNEGVERMPANIDVKVKRNDLKAGSSLENRDASIGERSIIVECNSQNLQ